MSVLKNTNWSKTLWYIAASAVAIGFAIVLGFIIRVFLDYFGDDAVSEQKINNISSEVIQVTDEIAKERQLKIEYCHELMGVPIVHGINVTCLTKDSVLTKEKAKANKLYIEQQIKRNAEIRKFCLKRNGIIIRQANGYFVCFKNDAVIITQ